MHMRSGSSANSPPASGSAVAKEIGERVLANLNDHYVFFDREWRYVYANDKAAEVLHRTKEELIGHCIWELFPDAVGNLFYRELHRAVAEGRDVVFDHYYSPFDRWFENRIYVSPDGVAVFSTDITDRKRAEEALRESEEALRESNQRIHDILESISDAFVSLDRDWRVTYVNSRVLQITSGWADTVVGRNVWELFPFLVGSSVEAACRKAMEERVPVRQEYQGPMTGNWYDLSIYPSAGGISVFGRDISDRKKIEGERELLLRALEEERLQLRTLNETLEQRVAERTRDLTRANRILEQRNRELQEFAYVASHDLQEPLRKIRSFSDILGREYSERLDGEARILLDRMDHAATRMSQLITELLSFSREATRGLSFEPVDLSRTVAEVLSDLEARLTETGGKVVVEELGTIKADPLQIRQLLQNLIGNALKFHREGVPPLVRLRSSVDTQPVARGEAPVPMCRIEVEDNGEGFDEKHAERIFTPFQRLHGRRFPGTGMGLSICRRIVERHGGILTATSKPGVGSRFVVILPVIQEGNALSDSA